MLQRLLKIKERHREEARRIEDIQTLVSEIEMLNVVLHLVMLRTKSEIIFSLSSSRFFCSFFYFLVSYIIEVAFCIHLKQTDWVVNVVRLKFSFICKIYRISDISGCLICRTFAARLNKERIHYAHDKSTESKDEFFDFAVFGYDAYWEFYFNSIF